MKTDRLEGRRYPRRNAAEDTQSARRTRDATAERAINSGRYTPPIPREVRHSPRWYPWALLSLLLGGVAVIIFDYIQLRRTARATGTPWAASSRFSSRRSQLPAFAELSHRKNERPDNAEAESPLYAGSERLFTECVRDPLTKRRGEVANAKIEVVPDDQPVTADRPDDLPRNRRVNRSSE